MSPDASTPTRQTARKTGTYDTPGVCRENCTKLHSESDAAVPGGSRISAHAGGLQASAGAAVSSERRRLDVTGGDGIRTHESRICNPLTDSTRDAGRETYNDRAETPTHTPDSCTAEEAADPDLERAATAWLQRCPVELPLAEQARIRALIRAAGATDAIEEGGQR